jgi:hypothetical protein
MTKRRTVYECDDCGRNWETVYEADRCSTEDRRSRDFEAASKLFERIEYELLLGSDCYTETKMREIYDLIAAHVGKPGRAGTPRGDE